MHVAVLLKINKHFIALGVYMYAWLVSCFKVNTNKRYFMPAFVL